jgi:hypothetical protein
LGFRAAPRRSTEKRSWCGCDGAGDVAQGRRSPVHRHVSSLETHKDSLVLGEIDFVNTMSLKGRVAEGIPKVAYATPTKICRSPRVDRRVSVSNNGNHAKLQIPVWTAANPCAEQLAAAVVTQDMESVSAGLKYGLGKTEVQAFLTGRHGQSDDARFYGHVLADAVRGQIKNELALRSGPERGR